MLPDAPLDGGKVEVLALANLYRLGHCSSLPSGVMDSQRRAALTLLRDAEPAVHDLRDKLACAHVTDEAELLVHVVLYKPTPCPAFLQDFPLSAPVAFAEVECHPGCVVQAPVFQVTVLIQQREDCRGAQEVLGSKAARRSRADHVYGLRPRRFEVAGDRGGIAQAAYQNLLAGDHPRRVLLGVRTQVVALYPLGTLLATSQEAVRIEPSAYLLGLLQARNRIDTPCSILENRQQG